MSDKEKISEQLSAYLDGELSADQSRRVAETVRDDPALAAELESLRVVQRLVRGLPAERAPAGLVEKVLARAGQAAPRKTAGWWMGRLARAAVVLLAVGVGITAVALFHPGRTEFQDREAGPTDDTLALRKPAPADWSGAMRYDVFKKSAHGEAGTVLAAATNILINTDNLVLTQREVEGVFANNSIKPMVEVTSELVAKSAPRARANFYNQTQIARNQVRYEVAIDEKQMRQIVAELNGIRARQNVAQIPLRDADRAAGEVVLAKVDDRPEAANGLLRKDKMFSKSGADKRPEDEGRLRRGAPGAKPAELERSKEEEKRRRELAGRPMAKADYAMAETQPAKKEVGKLASQPAPTRKPTTTTAPSAGVAMARAQTPAGPTTRPASVAAGQIRTAIDYKQLETATQRQTATLATANVRQLVVILNAVAARE